MASTPISSPEPSPSSSPVFGPIDSSPLSSPHLGPSSLDPPSPVGDSPLSHPFAGSTKAVKRPPKYEKKVPATPPALFSRPAGLSRVADGSRSLVIEDDDFNSSSPTTDSPPHRTSRYLDREERLWEEAIRKPFDTGNGHVDLSNQQLGSIPPFIGDLAGFFNTPEVSEQTLSSSRSLTRVNTEPPLPSSKTRLFERTQSIVDSGKERHVLQLYLSGNSIRSLPPQLFTLQNLSVLSLRGNQLTYLPGDICRLKNLRELNISLNRLTFLPWEIRDMKLSKLQLYPNPYLPEPSQPHRPTNAGAGRRTLSTRRSITRLASVRRDSPPPAAVTVSAVTTLFPGVPPLTELCFRVLLSPVRAGPDAPTVIADYYGVPLSDQWNIPPDIQKTLAECVPDLLRPRKRFSMDAARQDARPRSASQTGTARCARPGHEEHVFVRHAAERFTWERCIAGINVGGTVPLRWRGCTQTCLDFLDEDSGIADTKNGKGEVAADLGTFDTDARKEDVDMAIDLDEAVQVIRLGSMELSMDDFDD
ncbi:hypothetical protein ID866_7586 [Astraeus odoratus]|nr:hypothetical protein ID866_7586 [Astraeus odoratus]